MALPEGSPKVPRRFPAGSPKVCNNMVINELTATHRATIYFDMLETMIFCPFEPSGDGQYDFVFKKDEV